MIDTGAAAAGGAGGTAPPQSPSRRLAAIMFTDLVGYSALAHRDEALAIELLKLHREWVRAILPRHGGVEIETVGDAFLIEFAGALAAVECAVALQRRFAEHNRAEPARKMELRIGIHLGDVEHQDGKVMGDGVNIASRIHGMAQPGGICVSDPVYYAVRTRGGLQFKRLGTPELKNIATPLELFALAGDGMALRAAPAPSAARRYAVPLAAAALIAVAAFAAWRFAGRPAADAARRSVAVLPFENLSAEEGSAYFTDGLHDTVIGHLARIDDLKVISRTSVMAYRGQRGNLRQIASELGVAHVLEGSVQRAGTRLRVAAQLIDASTDAHVWSHEYDAQLADVFSVQADIARQVATAVHARLTPTVTAAIERAPTQNQEAYDLYLRALVVGRKAEIDPAEHEQAAGWLERAVALDPGFALAHAELAFVHDTMYWYGFDPTEARRERMRRAVDAASNLAPDLGATHVAKALYVYHGPRHYAEAIRELELARSLDPGDSRALYMLAAVYRRQDRWDEAVATMEQGAALDPLNAVSVSEYAWTLVMLRRYEEADRFYARTEALGPDGGKIALVRARVRFLRTGELQPLVDLLQRAPADLDAGCGLSIVRWYTSWLQRRFRDAVAAAEGCKDGYRTLEGSERVPTTLYAALAYDRAGERARARRAAEAARADLVQQLQAAPELAATRMALAQIHAVLGKRDAAVAEAERALADMPAARDGLVHTALLTWAAQMHAWLGDADRAIAFIERSLARPSGLNAHELRLDPVFDPVRDDPRFRKLVADHLPKESGT